MYAIGAFSKKTGVTLRTLRYYDEKNLLKPSYVSESGRRYYKDEDIITLQKIMTLKFLGYSLEEIETFINENDWDLHDSLLYQKEQLERKKEQIEQSIRTIDYAVKLSEDGETVESDVFIALIQNLRLENEQKSWLRDVLPEDVVEELYDYSSKEIAEVNRTFIKLTRKLKKAYRDGASEEEVMGILSTFIDLVPSGLITRITEIMEGKDIKLDAALFPSPFTPDEDAWLDGMIERLNILATEEERSKEDGEA